jgi:beta-lactamase regulating signal transducer with metallopeptidase domain
MISSVLDAALRALLVAAAVGAGLRLLRVSNVLAQKAAWGLVLAAALLMPFLLPLAAKWQILPPGAAVVLPAHPWRLFLHAQPGTNPTGSSSASATPTPLPASPVSKLALLDRAMKPPFKQHVSPAVSVIQTSPPISRPRAADARATVPTLSTIAWIVYLAVCSALLLRLLFGLASAFRLWQSAEPVILPSGQAAGLRLRSSRAVSSPVTIGSGIVLPANYGQWEIEKLRIVLAHERSHIRQGDFYLQLLAGLYAALFWFSPLGWWLKRNLSDLGEAISDRAGLEEAASRSSYAQILLEFAALPRPTLIGVAMARTSSLSHRIERLLNDSSFRQAFTGGRRALLAVLLVPVATFAATALVRVQAAEVARPASWQAPPPAAAPQPPQAPITGQSNPDQAQDAAAPAPQSPAPPQAPATPAPPAGPGSTVVPEGAPSTPPPPEPPDAADDSVTVSPGQTRTLTNTHTYTHTHINTHDTETGQNYSSGHGYAYYRSSDGDSYALVSGPDEHITFSGDWDQNTRATLDKARKLARGKFLWFMHNGKSYFIDDPAIVGSLEALYKPMEDLSRRQEELGRKQEELGKQQEELGSRQEQASAPTPDISKEMADLNAAVAKLQAKKGSTVSQEELAEIQAKIGDIQGKLGEIEGRIGEKQGELGELQGKLGAMQGKLGAEQGRLGAEQGRIAAEADRKIKSIINESLRNGKAKPVE